MHEATLTGLLAALAGSNIMYGLGLLDTGMTFDFAKLIMDTEMAKMIKRIIKGIPVNEETLAVDVIRMAGPSGEFMSQEQTLHLFKKEQSHSKLLLRDMRNQFFSQGMDEKDIKNYTERAYDVAKEIYDNHKPDPLPKGVASKLRDILNEAEEHYGLALTKE